MSDYDRIDNHQQMAKLFDAYNILVNNYFHTKPPVKVTGTTKLFTAITGKTNEEHLPITERPPLYALLSRFAGIIEGRMAERWKVNYALSLQDCKQILETVSNQMTIRGGDDWMNKIRGFFAANTDFIDQAFDIALNDKPLPVRIYNLMGTGTNKV
jgi:hypothetical protein